MPEANETELLNQADFLVLHLFVPMPDYILGYLQGNPDKWTPINAWFFDAEQTQPALIIYANNAKTL